MRKILDLFHRQQDIKKGILVILLAWLSFSLMYAIAKLIGDQTSIPTMIFFRNLLGLCFIFPWMIKHWPLSLEVKKVKLIVIRSIMGLLNFFLIFLSLKQISLVDAILLNNTAPLFVPLVVWIWLRIPLELKIWPAILIGFLGVVLILQPNKQIFNYSVAYALLSGICLAVSIVTMRLTSRHDSIHSFMLYFFALGLIMITPFAIAYWKIETGLTLLGLLSIGIFSGIGQMCFFYGLKHGQARHLAPFTYTTVIFSGILEWLIWDVVPKPIAYLGMFLIIGAGIWIFLVIRPPKESAY